MELKIGLIVKAIAGRDKNKFFIVKNFSSDWIFIVDGKSRKWYNPKKKSLKHVRFTNTVVDMSDMTDRKLRKILSEYMQKSAQT